MMIKIVVVVLSLVMVMATIIGCGSNKSAIEIPEIVTIELPDWVDNPPGDTDEFLYVVESGSSINPDRAKRMADQNARGNLALRIESEVQILIKNFDEEVGGNAESAENNALYADISRTVADQRLVGFRGKKYKTVMLNPEKNEWTVYVLAELPTEFIGKQVVRTISRDKAAYNRWRASESFKELEHAVDEKRSQEATE